MVNEIELVLAGPRLTMDDLRPYIIPREPNSLLSQVVGYNGQVRTHKRHRPMSSGKRPAEEYLVVKNGKRVMSVDFSRGEGYCLIRQDGKLMVVTRQFYDNRMKQKAGIQLVGS